MPDITEILSESEYVLAALKILANDLRYIRKQAEKGAINVDEYESHPGTTSLAMKHKAVRTPFICSQILVAYPVTSTSASLQIGGRTIPLPPAVGLLAFDCNMQIEYEDDIILTLAPSGPCFLELMGVSDKRIVDQK
jgi:hypothetical protein